MKKKIAIMQPYFAPYAGYFRLFSQTDLFVIYDCVQFPRRGWVHRNKLPDASGESQWLTMPIKKCSQSTKIYDLEFSDSANQLWMEQCKQFPSIIKANHEIKDLIYRLDKNPLDYIVKLLKFVCEGVGINFNVEHSSSLNIPDEIKGQDRIIEIAKYFQATDYVNSPGGKDLYNESAFKKEGINLHFLPEYKGNNWSMLHRLITEDPKKILEEINANS